MYEVTIRTPALVQQLVTVWEASVRATHLFLSDAEIMQIKAYVPQALREVAHLIVMENEPGQPVALMGVAGHRLEMLFIAPEARGAGLGRALLALWRQRADRQ